VRNTHTDDLGVTPQAVGGGLEGGEVILARRHTNTARAAEMPPIKPQMPPIRLTVSSDALPMSAIKEPITAPRYAPTIRATTVQTMIFVTFGKSTPIRALSPLTG
jgi:hypothetical protein